MTVSFQNRLCDRPGSWYCPGQYPPAIPKPPPTHKAIDYDKVFVVVWLFVWWSSHLVLCSTEQEVLSTEAGNGKRRKYTLIFFVEYFVFRSLLQVSPKTFLCFILFLQSSCTNVVFSQQLQTHCYKQQQKRNQTQTFYVGKAPWSFP